MSYVEKDGKFNVKKWNRENVHLQEEILTEEYIESMGPDFDNGLDLLADAWKDWKNGPMTEPSDIKPAQKELLNYITKWVKKNIK
tara:strand:+ start:62994 stop:63248 length:255 start_codon:yes stop_codon:yes gene_type:complete